MRTAAIALGFLAFVASAIDAYGHGTPIHINVTSAKLAISNGVADPAGYAAMIFLDGSDDAQLEHTFVPGFGNVALTNLPGFEIQDMLPDSGLFLNVFPQTVKDSNPIQQRLLWHWDPSTERVAVAPNGESLAIASEFGQINLPQSNSPVPPSLQVAHPLADDLGLHVHFLRYLLDDSPTAATGAYGFFSRLTSPNYTSSDPFLVILNNGLDEEQLSAAALAINAAAVEPMSRPGDYNGDGTVNAADYTVWRNTLGQTGTGLAADGNGDNMITQLDYEVWKMHFGEIAGNGFTAPDASGRLSAGVPEPSTWWLVAVAVAILGATTRPKMGRLFR